MFDPPRLFVAGAVVLGVLVAGVYLFLPLLFEVVVAHSLQGRLGLGSAPEVDVRGDPARMLAGEFGSGRVALPGYDLGGVRTDEVVIELAPFDVDVLGSLRGGQVLLEQPLSGTLGAELSEAEVARIAASEIAGFSVRGVELEEGLAIAQTEVYAFGQSVPVAVGGGVAARNDALIFEPSNVEAAGVAVPGEVAQGLLQGTGFVYPIAGLPPGVRITGAEVETGRLVLVGEVAGLPA